VSRRPPELFSVRLVFHGDLDFFLKRAAGGSEIVRDLREAASVKDLIESCGVPHPEVDRILVNDRPVGFTYLLQNNCLIDVYPVEFSESPTNPDSLQRRALDRFVADGHLGKLARNLRLLGFDVAYHRYADDPQLLEIMQREERALLTRDRRLLMHGIVRDGYCPRSSAPSEQTIEVIRRFQLVDRVNTFARCLQCNALLQEVTKADVIDQLEPLTRIYYDRFRRCTGCGKIYWRGSHFSQLEASLQHLAPRSHPGDVHSKS
jgi:uncharacterized protein